MKLEAAHKIQISTKRTLNCSLSCHLNVAIWEILVTDNIRQLRYHEWRGIYHLTWQVIAASYRGFSVHINATCDEISCRTKLCDVAVVFNTMLKWQVFPTPSRLDELLRDHFDIIWANEIHKHEPVPIVKLYEISRTDVVPGTLLNLTDMVYGSWSDAQHLHLGTITLMEELKHTINFQYPHYGWNHSYAYIFAGLHRRNEVSVHNVIPRYIEFEKHYKQYNNGIRLSHFPPRFLIMAIT